MRSLVIACGSGAIAPHAPTLVVNGAPLDPNASGVVVVGGGGGGWPVALDTGLLYRFDASDADTLTLSGGDVTAWADLGPDGLDLARSGSGTSPTYEATGLGGGPCVAIAQSGTAGNLQRSGVSIAYSGFTVTTVAAVYEPGVVGRDGAVVEHLDGGGDGFVLRDYDSTTRAEGKTYDAPTARRSTLRAPQVLIAALGPSVATLERNGTSVATLAIPGTVPNASGQTLYLGGGAYSGAGASRIGIVAAWSRALDASERTAFRDWCAARWTT